MDFNEYQNKVKGAATSPKDREIEYNIIDLMDKVGELAYEVKNLLRGDYSGGAIQWSKFQEDCKNELGAILQCTAILATALGIELSDVVEKNLEIRKRNNR